MSLKNEISAAIGAHGLWKVRLKDAIVKGSSEFQPSVVGRDDQCAFGKWLHGVSDQQVKSSPGYKKCVDLHREFHAQAAKVLDLALAHKQKEAEGAISASSHFARVSAELTSAMLEWNQKAG